MIYPEKSISLFCSQWRSTSSSYSYDQVKRIPKLQELRDLLNRHYSYQDARDVWALVYANLFNEGNEDFLDKTLTHVRDIDRKSRSGFN